MSGLSNGQQAILMLLVFILPVWVAWTANGSPTDRTSLSLVFSGSLGGILAFIKEILGGKPSETTASTTSSTSTSPGKTQLLIRSFPSKFKFFFSGFLHDRTAMAGRHRKHYDPDPRRRSHRGHRKGVEPAGLKRWRLAHRRTHDPSPARHYFHRRRRTHDPAPRFRPARQYFARHPRYRRAGSKLERGINKYGGFLGALLSAITGIFTGYSDYQTAYGPSAVKNYWASIVGGDIYDAAGTKIGTRTPEISKLWGTNDSTWGGGIDLYLKYKFLGLDATGKYKGSAWVIPFWTSLVATIAAPIARLFTHKGQRFLRPISKIGQGALIISTIGALALPGSPKKSDVVNGAFPPVPPNQNNNKIGGAF
jgi:hypothetical protein